MYCRHAALSWQQAVNEADQSWPSIDAHRLLSAAAAAADDDDDDDDDEAGDSSTHTVIIERLNKPHQANQCIRVMTDLPEVSYVHHSFFAVTCHSSPFDLMVS